MRVETSLLVAALLLAAPATASRSDTAPSQQDVHEAREGVRRLLARSEPAAPDVLARELATLGPAALPALFEELVASGHNGRQSGARATTLDRLWACLERGAVRTFLAERCAGDASPEVRRAAVGVVGSIGRAEELDFALDLLGEHVGMDGACDAALQRTVRRILERDERAFRVLAALVREGRSEVVGPLLRGAAEASPAATLELVTGLIGSDPSLDRALLSHVGPLVQAAPLAADSTLANEVWAYLSSSDSQLVRASAQALGHLRAENAVPDLAELLDRDDAALRQTAHWALTQITGASFPADSGRWNTWWKEELAWYRERGPYLLDRLSHPSSTAIAEALGELSRHRIQRQTIADRVLPLLADRRPGVRMLACRSLQALGSTRCVPALAERLDDPDPEVAAAAWTAVRALSRLDLPRDVEESRRMLASAHPTH